MKLSFNWLADYIDLAGLTPEIVAEKLTMNAFEVEGIDTFGPDLVGPIVVGEIIDIQAHPDPKVTKMRVTKVIVEKGQEPIQIVCGASNILVGQHIPVALPGAIVVNRHDGSPFPITVADRRGVESRGMLCSASELGITDGDQDGILILDSALNYKLGDNVQDLLSLYKDYVLTIGSRSNRGDAVCVRGLAREVSALFKRPMHEPKWQLEESDKKSNFSVDIQAPNDCEYFTIRSLSNIKIGSTPSFIVRRLAAVGTRSINNIVDITNYVMHEWGQPMHAYDARAVKDGKFIVRRGKVGEKYTTLDGKERTLTDEMLIIADPEKVIGMPIMGGANSEINASTTDIALEAASFLPATVRRSSRLLGLSSESALRFERGIDAGTTKQASDRAAYLISKYCTGSAPVKVGPLVAGGKGERPVVHLELRPSEIKRHLNINLSNSEITDLLTRLEFSSLPSDKSDKLIFSIPSFRQSDIRREIDLIEEVSRMYGYDNLKEELPSFIALTQMPDNIDFKIRQSLAGQGFCEAYITSLIPDQPVNSQNADSKYLPSFDGTKAIKVLNPLSPEHQVLRQSLLPGLITALKYNFDRGEENVWLFELGYAYFKHAPEIKSSQPACEELKVSGVLTGNHQLSLWQDVSEQGIGANNKSNTHKLGFYEAKGVLQNLFQSLNLPISQIQYLKASRTPTEMHPGQTAQIAHHDLVLGWLGQLHPSIVQDLGVDSNTYLFELDIAALKALSNKPSFQAISTLPPVTRDLTVDLPQHTQNAAVENCMQEASSNLKHLALVSIFPLNNELKSLSYRLTFQSDAETLKSEDIDKVLTNIRKNLQEKLSASFRA